MTEKRMVSTGHWVAWAWCDPEQFLCHIVTVSAGCSQAIPLVPSVPPCGVRAVETMQGRFPTVSYITAEEATGEEEWNSAPKKRQLLSFPWQQCRERQESTGRNGFRLRMRMTESQMCLTDVSWRHKSYFCLRWKQSSLH